MDSLFDQSKLIALAERLIKAARAAGADAADAVAMRSVSQSVDVRDGAVEESQRSEGDDMGLRVLIGRKQAVVSTNDMSGDGVTALAERAVAMARVAPEDKYAGLADPALLAKNFPDLDLFDRELPDVQALEAMARRAEEAGRAVRGVSKSGGASAAAGIGGMVLLTSHGFSGAYLGSRHSISMQAIAGEGTGMETDYDFSSALHASDLDAPEKIGRSAGEKAVAKLNPRKVSTKKVPVVFDSHVAGSIIGHMVSATTDRPRHQREQLEQHTHRQPAEPRQGRGGHEGCDGQGGGGHEGCRQPGCGCQQGCRRQGERRRDEGYRSGQGRGQGREEVTRRVTPCKTAVASTTAVLPSAGPVRAAAARNKTAPLRGPLRGRPSAGSRDWHCDCSIPKRLRWIRRLPVQRAGSTSRGACRRNRLRISLAGRESWTPAHCCAAPPQATTKSPGPQTDFRSLSAAS